MKIQVTEPFRPLIDEADPNYHKRYLVWYGGRGSGKSVTISKGLLIRGMKKPERILCAREFQNSISDSVIKTLEDEVDIMGLRDFYEVQNNGIFGKNGTEFIFKGLKNNIQSIKSIPGITIAWIEEGQTISDKSLDILIPTVRAEGSQIFISMNPDLEDDPIYQRFINKPPPDAFVKKVNYDENPFLPDTLKKEMEYLKATNSDKFNNIWLGHPQKMNEGSILGKWLVAADEEKRITTVPYNPSVPVITAWDLGYSDATVIWFAQVVGKEPRLIDFYQGTGVALDHYVNVIRSKSYNYEMHVLPHDAGHNSLRTGKTMAQQLMDMGLGNDNTVMVLPVDSVETGIELVRQLLPQLWIDKDKCEQGIRGLKKYRYEWDEERKMFKPRPLHDWASDIADSLRYMATYLSQEKTSIANIPEPGYYARELGFYG